MVSTFLLATNNSLSFKVLIIMYTQHSGVLKNAFDDV